MTATTIGVVIPLPEEMRAFSESFSEDHWTMTSEMRGARVFYTYRPPSAACTQRELRIVVTVQEAMGNGPAQEAASAMISHYTPDVIVGLGICGAIHKDLRIGDVVVVNAVFDVIDAAKVEDPAPSAGGSARPDSLNFELKLMSRPQVPTPLIVNRASQFEWWAKDEFEVWQRQCFERLPKFGLDPTTTSPRNDVHGERREEVWTHGKPQILCGASASGFVMEALTFLKVHAFNRELRIVETECAGVARACRGEHVLTPYVFLRVVTDYADKTSRGNEGARKTFPDDASAEQKREHEQALLAQQKDQALKREENDKRRQWATRNVMGLFRELAKKHEFIESVHGAIERQWDASVLLGRFRESREIEFPRNRALALAQVFTALVNDSSDSAPPDRKRLCISAESLALTAVNWEFAKANRNNVLEVWVLRMSPALVEGLAGWKVMSPDVARRFEINLERLRDSFPYARFRVGEAPNVTPFHGTFHGDTFWIGHWEVDENIHKLTSSTGFKLINGRNAPDLAEHYRNLFVQAFLDAKNVRELASREEERAAERRDNVS
ncbi:MAG TPA: hypothetical protein VFQ61_16480 [Polyangiaceae bacterium]|nr:hypothetical protein [Polyangiaceae bacterium]